MQKNEIRQAEEQFPATNEDLNLLGLQPDEEQMLYEPMEDDNPSLQELWQDENNREMLMELLMERCNETKCGMQEVIDRNQAYIEGYFAVHTQEHFLEARQIRDSLEQFQSQEGAVYLSSEQHMAIFEVTLLEAKVTEIEECTERIRQLESLEQRMAEPEKHAENSGKEGNKKHNSHEYDR